MTCTPSCELSCGLWLTRNCVKYILLMKSAAPRLHGMGMAAAGWMTDGRVARRRLDTE